MRTIILLMFLIASYTLQAKNQTDTISIYSALMHKDIKNVVIVPENYKSSKAYPVVYILHGYSDNYAKWVTAAPVIKQLSTIYQTIIVCPDGGFSSWYFDSPIDTTYRYESYIIKELIPYIDLHYKTIASKESRAITGHSMGGHGALYIAIRNPKYFKNAGSMSGGVDLHASIGKFDVSKRIGTFDEKPTEWLNRSAISMVEKLKNNELNLILDCGVNDFFYDINKSLHQKLIQLKIDHDYIERPGIHNWDYWRNAIQFQFLFFNNQFTTNTHNGNN